MKIHLATSQPNRFGGFTTHTLCGRESQQSADGCNSTAAPSEVTCKFCLKQMAADEERARWKEWRAAKKLAKQVPG